MLKLKKIWNGQKYCNKCCKAVVCVVFVKEYCPTLHSTTETLMNDGH